MSWLINWLVLQYRPSLVQSLWCRLRLMVPKRLLLGFTPWPLCYCKWSLGYLLSCTETLLWLAAMKTSQWMYWAYSWSCMMKCPSVICWLAPIPRLTEGLLGPCKVFSAMLTSWLDILSTNGLSPSRGRVGNPLTPLMPILGLLSRMAMMVLTASSLSFCCWDFIENLLLIPWFVDGFKPLFGFMQFPSMLISRVLNWAQLFS